MTAAALHRGPGLLPSARETSLWLASAVVVVVLHAVAVHALQSFQTVAPAEASEPALMIDLSPLAVTTPDSVESETLGEEMPVETLEPVEELPETMAEEAEPMELAALDLPPEPVREEVTEVEPAPPVEPEMVEPAETPVETALAQDVPPETVEPAEPSPVEPDPIEPEAAQQPVEADIFEANPPEIFEQVLPDVVAALPEVKPIEEVVEKPRPVEKKVEARRKPAPKTERRATEKPAPRKQAVVKQAAPSKRSAKSVASRAPTISPARWQSRVLSWINRHKRYPSGARSRREQGQVQVSFAINAAGAVVSARIARSSGNAELDKAALDMVRRASPVPAPPPEIARSRINLAVPVQFSLR